MKLLAGGFDVDYGVKKRKKKIMKSHLVFSITLEC